MHHGLRVDKPLERNERKTLTKALLPTPPEPRTTILYSLILRSYVSEWRWVWILFLLLLLLSVTQIDDAHDTFSKEMATILFTSQVTATVDC